MFWTNNIPHTIPGWGLGAGLTTLSRKKLNVTETRSVNNDTTQSGGVAAGALRILLCQNRREAQRPMGPIVAPKQQLDGGIGWLQQQKRPLRKVETKSYTT